MFKNTASSCEQLLYTQTGDIIMKKKIQYNDKIIMVQP